MYVTGCDDLMQVKAKQLIHEVNPEIFELEVDKESMKWILDRKMKFQLFLQGYVTGTMPKA